MLSTVHGPTTSVYYASQLPPFTCLHPDFRSKSTPVSSSNLFLSFRPCTQVPLGKEVQFVYLIEGLVCSTGLSKCQSVICVITPIVHLVLESHSPHLNLFKTELITFLSPSPQASPPQITSSGSCLDWETPGLFVSLILIYHQTLCNISPSHPVSPTLVQSPLPDYVVA